MYLINKIDDRTISINGDNYPANFMARSSGDEIIISARTGTDLPFMKGKVGKFEINGAPATSADEAVVLLNSFIGNFRRGGSSPSPTLQEKLVSYDSNGDYAVLPDSGFDGLSKVDVNVNVPSASGGKSVVFYDYDGTVVASYTLEEAQALMALPEQPTHEYLTGTGWTHTLEQVRSATDPLHVGAMYRTTDGKTRAFVTLTPVSGLTLLLYLSVSVGTTARIDWGDGQTQDVSYGTITFTHDYASVGEYEITIERISGGATYRLGGASSNTSFVGGSASYRSQTLTKLYIGDNATIGSFVFSSHHSLTSVVIPNSVTSIDSYTFSNCYSLTSVVIPNNVTYIGTNVFYNCRALTSVVIPNSVTTIGSNAFQYCTSLTSVVIPNSVTIIGSAIFDYCTSLTSMVIPNSIMSTNSFVFRYCYSLTSVVIPNSVTNIGNGVFQFCNSLTSVVIPNSVTSIGNNVFQECFSLKEYVLNKEVPPTLGTTVFTGIVSICKIYVPDASVNDYKTATNWASFSNYIYPISERP